MSSVRITYDSFAKTAPGAQAALIAMGKTADESGFDKEIVELAKLRVSQINNCAFCLQIHLNVSRKLGIAQEKLDLVATWHEAGIFLRARMRSTRLGRSTDASSWPQRLRRRLRRRPPAFQRKRSGVPEYRHRHHQRLEPSGRRLPLCAADPKESGRGGVMTAGKSPSYLARPCRLSSG
jgi:AhpD family alkylhydroperoxidase